MSTEANKAIMTATEPRPQVRAYAASAAHAPLQPFQYTAPALGPLDVEIEITHCGICHSDLHLINNDWGISPYPLVPGHEIVGYISAIGSAIEALHVGQRVGVGWQAGSCLECEWCLGGDENLCAQAQPTCVGRFGGYADRIRLDSHFAFPLPDALDSAAAAPLLCGGATVFSPMLHYGVNADTRLGIVSVGGLGHMALEFGRAFGCAVTAFSSSSAKEADARQFGATTFVNLQDEDAMAAQANSLDLVITTASADLPWPALANTLRPKGVLCVVGVPPNPVAVPAFALLLGNRMIAGSNTGSRAAITKMLDFAAHHGVRPQIEHFPMREVNAALDRLRSGEVRYRIVLEN